MNLGYDRTPLWEHIRDNATGEVVLIFHAWKANPSDVRNEAAEWFGNEFPHAQLSAEDDVNYASLHMSPAFVAGWDPNDTSEHHTSLVFARAGWVPKDTTGALYYFDPSCSQVEKDKTDKVLGMEGQELHTVGSLTPEFVPTHSKVTDLFPKKKPDSSQEFTKQLDKIDQAIFHLEQIGKDLTMVEHVSLKRLKIARAKLVKAKTMSDPDMQHFSGIDVAKEGDSSIAALFNVGLHHIHDSVELTADYSEIEAHALTQSIMATIQWKVVQSPVDSNWKVTGTIKFDDKKWACNAHIDDAAMNDEFATESVIGAKAGITEQLAEGVAVYVKQLAKKAATASLQDIANKMQKDIAKAMGVPQEMMESYGPNTSAVEAFAQMEMLKDLVHGKKIGDFAKFCGPISGGNHFKQVMPFPSFAKLTHNGKVVLYDADLSGEEAKFPIKPEAPGSDLWVVIVPKQNKSYTASGIDVYDQQGTSMGAVKFEEPLDVSNEIVEVRLHVAVDGGLAIPPPPPKPKMRELQLTDALGRKKVIPWPIQNPLLPFVEVPVHGEPKVLDKSEALTLPVMRFQLDKDTKMSHTPRYWEVRA